MTDYNIDFLIAGLVFLIFLLIHFQRYKKLNNISGRTFWFLIIAGIFDIIFDLLSSILLVKSNPAYNSWMIFFSTMLYILQMIVVYIFYNYTQALRHCDEDIRTRNIKIMAVPILCMEVAIVTNVLHKQFFYCNEQGQYVHGKAYLVTYIFTLICIAAVIINCFINQEEYQKNELRAIKEFLGVALVCVTIQMKFQSVLMTGFGLSLGITILFWALYNPQLYIDSLTGLYSKGYFRRWFPEQIKRKKELHLLMIDLWKLKQVNKLYGVTTGDELLKSGYSKKLLRTIEEFDIPFSYFQFEITETVATEYSEALYQTIADFKKSGIQICLDDFGSGYANLNTVLKLPFSTIKLDRSLLNGICYDDQVALLYKNIVAVMQNLGHKVVAEGVETQEEIDLLKQWGVDLVQGYYYTKPLDSEQIIHKLEEDVC